MTVPSLSLFTGAGGLDLGAIAAGCHSRACLDIDPICIQTLRSNSAFGNTVVMEADLRTTRVSGLLDILALKKGELPVLIGGPPCQSFSKAAYWTSTGYEAARRRRKYGYAARRKRHSGKVRNTVLDPRTNLVNEYLRILRGIKPEAFVFENVLSILHPTNREIFQNFVTRCKQAGYVVTVLRVNAAEFGVAQRRERIFVVGVPKGATFTPPKATHASPSRGLSRKLRGDVKPAVSVSSVIGPFSSARFSEPEEIVSGRWAQHLAEIPPGWNYKALTAWAGYPKPVFEAETRFWNFLLKLHPSRPSWTIAANPGPWIGPFHWNNRRLRIPELAAVQDFPRAFHFSGTRRQIQRQIGNAVPPRVAEAVVSAVLSSLGYKSAHL